MTTQGAIRHFDGLNRTPALPLAVRGWMELLERGWAANLVLVGWDHQALVYFEGTTPVGVLTYHKQTWAKAWDVQIGYVLPSHRRKGIYRALWGALVERARQSETPVVTIEGSMHDANVTMVAVATALGRTCRSTVWVYALGSDGADNK